MKPFVKICGITREDDALFASELGADALGFNFYPKSPRYISPESAAQIVMRLPTTVKTVGVFVNAPLNTIERIVLETGIQVVQLHGDEDAEMYRTISVPVWKGVRLKSKDEIDNLKKYEIDLFVVDTHRNGLYGGTGEVGDWGIAEAISKHYRILLAGGLNPENILDAIERVNPYGIDVNSGVESAPGLKGKEKMKRLFNVIKQRESN